MMLFDKMNDPVRPARPAVLRLAAAMLFLVAAALPARAAVDIAEVTSSGGVTAWLVEDYTVPIVSIRFAFRGGSAQDPEGKAGIANLMTGLFDEGAGDLSADAFQTRMDRAGVSIRFDAGRDVIYGRMRVLAGDAEEGFELLRLAVTEPRFDEEPLERIRAQIVARIVADSRDPEEQAQRAFAGLIYGDHPYARPTDGTVESLAGIVPRDLHEFHDRVFARGNLHVGVVGAIDAERLETVLDEVFGALPAEPDLVTVPDVEPKLGERLAVAHPLSQTSLQLVYPGVERDDPAFFAAYVMNHILGGGTFSSRLFNELREKRGLVYGVGSSLVNRDHASALVVGTSTRPERAEETLALIRTEIARMAADGPTREELRDAKRYLIGAYPINNLDSSSSIAATLVELQIEDLGIDYIDRREAIIDGVSREAVAEQARRLLTAEPSVLIVGQDITSGG